MSTLDPPALFPDTLFTEGEASLFLDFDFPGGIEGAYHLLRLDALADDDYLWRHAKRILLEERQAVMEDLNLSSKRLAAVAIIACARATGKVDRDGLPCHWDDLLGLIYSLEMTLYLEGLQLPVPGPRSRWTTEEDTDGDGYPQVPLAPAAFVGFNVDNDGSLGASCAVLTADPKQGKVQLLVGGEYLDAPGSVAALSFLKGHLVGPPNTATTDVPYLSTGLSPGMNGLQGVSRSQLRKLTRQSGMRLQLCDLYPDGTKKLRPKQKKVKEVKSPVVGNDDVISLQKKVAELEASLEKYKGLLAAEQGKVPPPKVPAPNIASSTQTDPVPLPDPLIITRPSSPVFLPVLPSSDKELEMVEENDKLKEDLRVQREETEKVKVALRTTALENADLHLRLQSSDSLLSVIHHTRPFVATVCKRFEPLTAVLPVAAVDWATKKGVKAIEGIVQREESEIGRLRREIDQLEKQLEAVNAPPTTLARSASLAATSTHPLSAPSGRAAYATWRLGEQVKALTREVREMREENVDLIVQLSQ